MNVSSKLIFGALIALAVGSSSRQARAQTDPAAAQALFDEAKKLLADERYDEACPKFAESQRLDPGGGTLLNLATCYQRAGKTASAWQKFKEALAGARRDGRDDRASFAREQIAIVEPLLLRVTIRVAADATVEGLQVRRDGTIVNDPSWGTAIPVDPGSHEITAEAPGYESWSTTVEVSAETGSQQVEVPALQKSDAVELRPPQPVVEPRPPTDAPPAAQPTEDGSAQRAAGFVVAGVGAAAAIVGAVFGGMALSKESEANDLCGNDEDVCSDQAGVDASDDARFNATLANGLIFGGLGLIGVGMVVALTAPSGVGEAETALRLDIDLATAKLGLRVRW